MEIRARHRARRDGARSPEHQLAQSLHRHEGDRAGGDCRAARACRGSSSASRWRDSPSPAIGRSAVAIAWLASFGAARRRRALGLLPLGIRVRTRPRLRARDHQGAGHDLSAAADRVQATAELHRELVADRPAVCAIGLAFVLGVAALVVAARARTRVAAVCRATRMLRAVCVASRRRGDWSIDAAPCRALALHERQRVGSHVVARRSGGAQSRPRAPIRRSVRGSADRRRLRVRRPRRRLSRADDRHRQADRASSGERRSGARRRTGTHGPALLVDAPTTSPCAGSCCATSARASSRIAPRSASTHARGCVDRAQPHRERLLRDLPRRRDRLSHRRQRAFVRAATRETEAGQRHSSLDVAAHHDHRQRNQRSSRRHLLRVRARQRRSRQHEHAQSALRPALHVLGRLPVRREHVSPQRIRRRGDVHEGRRR